MYDICIMQHRSDTRLAARRRSGRAARRAPHAAARSDRGDRLARRGGRRVRHFVSRRRGDCCATTSASSVRPLVRARARSRRESHGAGRAVARRAGAARAAPRANAAGARGRSRPAAAPRRAPPVPRLARRRESRPRARGACPRRCPTSAGVALDVSRAWAASSRCANSREGRADIAGFHVPVGAHAALGSRAVPALRCTRGATSSSASSIASRG